MDNKLETNESILFNELNGKTIFITGSTGLIGSCLTRKLIDIGSRVIVLVRNIDKAEKLFGSEVSYYEGNVENLPSVSEKIDYIIHAANPTSSKFFVSNPVETIKTAINGTQNILDLALRNSVKGIVYTSTMEVYGHPAKEHKVKENEIAGFDTTVTRNSYPLSKQMSEALCVSYWKEHDVPAKIVRLTQTFGPGVEYGDSRIFAELMRCVIEHKDITLHTKGETERCYLYTEDAVSAILTVLLKGNSGEAYTAANEDTYCSIKDMAEMVAAIGNVNVRFVFDGLDRGYADTLYMNLDTSKLQALGWTPKTNLKEMYEKMIGYCRKNMKSK